ncbi:MAG: hypothetical protein ACI8ZM_003276 [Crocinitomix sp.]|jgi:hypothetical protein
MKKLFNLVICLFVGYNGISQSLVTDRPTQGVSSEVVQRGQFQIESGLGVELHTTGAYGFPTVNRSFTVPTSLFRIGLTDFLEARFVNTLRCHSTQYAGGGVTPRTWQIDDLQIGAKVRIFKGDGWKPQVGFMSHVIMPVGSDHQNRFGVVNRLLISQNFKNGLSLGYNFGYDYLGKGWGNLSYTISAGFSVTERIGVYMEAYRLEYFHIPSHADAGFTFLLKDNMQLDYSFGLELAGAMNYQALGFSILFDK